MAFMYVKLPIYIIKGAIAMTNIAYSIFLIVSISTFSNVVGVWLKIPSCGNNRSEFFEPKYKYQDYYISFRRN